MKLTLDSEVFYKWLVKHRFDVCIVVAIVWVGLVVLVLWPMGPAAKFEFVPTLKSAGKALAPLGIVLTLFLNFTTAVKGEVGKTPNPDDQIQYRRLSNGMRLVERYDSKDFLAAKQWLSWCFENQVSSQVVAQRLAQMKVQYISDCNLDQANPHIPDPASLRTNVYVSVRRLINFLDEVRLSTTISSKGPNGSTLLFADPDIVFAALAEPLVSLYAILEIHLRQEAGSQMANGDDESSFQKDHNTLKRALGDYLGKPSR